MNFFLSSTYEDLKDVRKAAINFLYGIIGDVKNSTGELIAMEFFDASMNTCKEECLRQLDASDIVIGIYGERYGTMDDETGLSMTEIEFDYAKEAQKPILAFVQRTENREEKETEFLKNKVFSTHKSCANFVNTEDFLDRLNGSLKKYLETFEGYSFNSLWSQVTDIKDKIVKTIQEESPEFERQMIPYNSGDIRKSIDYIIDNTIQMKDVILQLSEENQAIHDYAYASAFELGKHNLLLKKQTLHNIDKISEKVLQNWENINLLLNNTTTGIILAGRFLKLRWMQQRLVNETWTEELRQEVIKMRDNYIDTIFNSQHID